MAKPQQELSSHAYKNLVDDFYTVIAKIAEDPKELQILLQDVLTPSEIKMMHRRWHVACELYEGKTIRDAAATAHVGTDTAIRVSKRISSNLHALKRALAMYQEHKHGGGETDLA